MARVGRPARPLDPDKDDLHRLAFDLRTLREEAGRSFEWMAANSEEVVGYARGKTAFQDAAGGLACPSWETLFAFVVLCEGEPADFKKRWENARRWQETRRTGQDLSPKNRPVGSVEQPDTESAQPRCDPPDDPGDTPPDVSNTADPGQGSRQHWVIRNWDRLRGWRRWLVVVVLGLVVAGVVYLAVVGPPTHVTGVVRCANGAEVVGVFVRAERGRSEYANWLPTTDLATARFDYWLTQRTAWKVNVGCGGNTGTWRNELRGLQYTSASQQDWICRTTPRSERGCRPS